MTSRCGGGGIAGSTITTRVRTEAGWRASIFDFICSSAAPESVTVFGNDVSDSFSATSCPFTDSCALVTRVARSTTR